MLSSRPSGYTLEKVFMPNSCAEFCESNLQVFFSRIQSSSARKTSMSMCFVDAYWAKERGKINERQYISSLVAHFGGLRHLPTDERPDAVCQEPTYEPFAASIRKAAFTKTYHPVKGQYLSALTQLILEELTFQYAELKPYEQLFQDCLDKEDSDVEAGLFRIGQTNPDMIPIQPLAVLAAREGRGKILQLCLDRGAVIDRHLARSIGLGNIRHPELEKVTAPYDALVQKATKPRVGPDGKYTAEQLEEWYGGINW